MGKFDGVLLASDYDDTLYGTDMTVSAENVKAIEYFTAQGGTFTVATGRAHRTFEAQAPKVPCNAPVILSGGAALYDFRTGRYVCETFLPRRVKEDLKELCSVFPSLGFEAYHGDDIYVHQPNAVTMRHICRAQVDFVERPIDEMPEPWSKVILQQEHEILLPAQNYMLEHWGEHYEVIFSNPVLLELTCKGSNKGGMVLRLAEMLGISREHIYCVGDNQNDIPMLSVSAIPFAPSGCAPEVRAWGPRLVGSCDESCIAQIIGILDERYS